MTVDLSHTDLAPVHGQSSGPPLLILHGLYGSKRNWTSVAKVLSSHHRVMTVDLRNHGESPWTDGMSYDDLARDIEAFIHHRGLAGCTLIGHSMGGKTAMTLALRAPSLIGRLVVVDIAPVPRNADVGAYIPVMEQAPLENCRNRKDVENHLAPDIPNPAVRQFLLQNLVRENGVFQWRLNLKALRTGMADIANFPTFPQGTVYPGPSLFIKGERSDYIQTSHSTIIQSLFPHAGITTIKGVGHWLHAEAQEEFLAVVTDFLNRTTTTASS